MRQALSALTLSIGLLTFPVTALADSDRSHGYKNSHKKSSDHKHLEFDQAMHERRANKAELRQHTQRAHRKLHKIDRQHRIKQHKIKKHRIKQQRIKQHRIKQHRIKKYRHYNGHNYNKWQARRHYSHRPHHHYHYRHEIKHHDNDYLEWLGIMLLLDEVLEDDYR
jgi:hypothetical protein